MNQIDRLIASCRSWAISGIERESYLKWKKVAIAPPGWLASRLTAKALRKQRIAECGANPNWLRAAGYWCRGAVTVHDVYEE